MPISRRKRFSLRATLAYAVFATLWIFLSDQVLATFSDAATITRYSTFKGLLFIAVTTAILWGALQNAPADAESSLPGGRKAPTTVADLLWGLLIPLMAAGLQWLCWSAIDPFAWLLFYPAVFAAAWLGGWRGGVLSTVLSTALAWYVFLPPTLSWQLSKPSSLLAIGVFLCMGLLMSVLLEWLRQAEQQAGDSKFKALVEQSLAGIYIVQGEHLRYANPEFARMMGYDNPAEIIDRVSVRELAMSPEQSFESPGDEVRHAFSGRRRDGSAVELEVHGRAVFTAEGPLVIGLALDVSERRRTEAALQRSEQLLRAVVEGTTDAIFVKDQMGRYVMLNQAAARFMGRPIEQVIGRDDTELFPPSSAALILAGDQDIKAKGLTVTTEDHLTMPSGQALTFMVTKGPVFDAQGQMAGIFGIARDITATMSAKDTLRDKQTLLDRMSTLAKVGGWGMDARTMQGTRTDGAARILDLDPSLPSSMTFTDGLRYFQGAEHERISQTLRQAIEHGKPYALELELISEKGVRKWIRTQGEPVWKDGQVVRLEGAIQDISEVQQARLALQAHQEKLEETVRQRTCELEAAREEAERLTRIKSDFLANMSHEIRTPLNGVLGLAQIGHRAHGGPAHPIFAQILDSGRLLLGIINDILDFSKIESGLLHIEILPVNLPALLTRAVAQIQERAQAKGIGVTLHLSPELPTSCDSDPIRLEQILLNLLSNAVKFTTQGQVSVSAAPRDGLLVLTVADTGIGMSAEQVSELFRPFEQADGSTTRQYGGTGLGLTITKRLVELLGGQIQAHSDPGQGARFEVVLPLVRSSEAAPVALNAQAPAAPSTSSEPVRRLARLRVLAAEDNQVNQLVLHELLHIEGAVITMVDSGLAAVDCLMQQGPGAFDLVLMDIQMPQMDGHEATRRIKAIAPSLPVIGQSAHAMDEERSKCLDSGMVDLVVKPIYLDALVHTVLRHVAARAADAE